MSQNPEDLPEDLLENVDEVMNSFSNELREIYSFRDLFFENHPIDMAPEKNKLVEEKKTKLLEKFEAIDVERHIPDQHRAQFLYMKGRCCNISPVYDAQAVQYLSKAVKLNPRLVEAWNELGECYWKNLNIKEAKYSFEGGLKFERSVVALRCLSILLRQECSGKSRAEARPIVLKSVELAREAVAQNVQDGQSWSVLGNAYLCQIITLGDEPTFKLCTGAYDQAWKDPIARSLPDLSYNRAVVSRFEESYAKALMLLEHSCRLDPQWQPPRVELARLTSYLRSIDDLVRTRGKIKERKLTQMVKRLDKRMVGEHAGVEGARVVPLAELCAGAGGGGGGGGGDGSGAGEVALGVVVGSVHHENTVPFTFAMADGSGACVCVTVYNWASGRGVIIGDCVCVPRPRVAHHQHRRDTPGPKYDFKSIRVDDPTRLVVNGRPVPADQYATTRISSTYEAQ